MVGALGNPRIGAVPSNTQELHLNEHVEHPLAQRPLDAAESLRLFKRSIASRAFPDTRRGDV